MKTDAGVQHKQVLQVHSSRTNENPVNSPRSGESLERDRETSRSVLLSRGIPRALRIRKRRYFLRLQRSGTRAQTPHLIAYLIKNNHRPVRFGLTVSKKVGKAHLRNRVKRLIREAFRHSELRYSQGFDISLVAKRFERIPTRDALILELNQLASTPIKHPREYRNQSNPRRKRKEA
jgi:ribonuclease P protein component